MVNRLSEGVDLEIVGADRFAMEVKTTEGSSVTFEDKDVIGLQTKAESDGYLPTVAVLRVRLFDDWIIADAKKLKPGPHSPERLALRSLPDLEAMARKNFREAVEELREGILNPPPASPLEFLQNVLESESIPH